MATESPKLPKHIQNYFYSFVNAQEAPKHFSQPTAINSPILLDPFLDDSLQYHLWIWSKCLCLAAGTSLTRTQAKAQKRSVFIAGGVGIYFITNKLLCLPPPKVVSLQLRRKCHEINRNTENVIIIYCIYKMYFKSLEWTRFHTIICRYCIDISQQSRRVQDVTPSSSIQA